MVSIAHVIWGVLLILGGISLIVPGTFILAWPFLRILIAGLLIYKGLCILAGKEYKSCKEHDRQ